MQRLNHTMALRPALFNRLFERLSTFLSCQLSTITDTFGHKTKHENWQSVVVLILLHSDSSEMSGSLAAGMAWAGLGARDAGRSELQAGAALFRRLLTSSAPGSLPLHVGPVVTTAATIPRVLRELGTCQPLCIHHRP